MPTIAGLFSTTGPVTIATRPATRSASASGSSAASGGNFADLNTIYRRVLELNRALAEAEDAFQALRAGTAQRTQAGTIASVSSSAALGLDLTPAFAALGSTAELNTIATSYDPFGPNWTGSSTAPPTVGGTYSGSTDDRLRFYVTSTTATVGGSRAISIRMYDRNGTRNVQTLSLPAYSPPGTQLTYSNGIKISLGAGTAVRYDAFWVNVWKTRDSEVKQAKPFNGTRNDNPNLQPGLAVTAGSFQVNGTSIPVLATDSVDSVIGKINDSAAGVTASYSATTERVTMTADVADYSPITLSGDTSGFLAAAKLTGAVSSYGSAQGDLTRPMDIVTGLSAAAAGAITINETAVAIDPATDSLDAVIDRINDTVPGVTAGFDQETQLVSIAAEEEGETLTLADGGTGFLASVGLEETVVESRARTVGNALAARRARGAIEGVQTALENLYAIEVTDSRAQTTLQSVLSSVEAALSAGLGDGEGGLAEAGLAFDTDADRSERVVDLIAGRFERALRSDAAADLREVLVGSVREDGDGLLGLLLAAGRGLADNLHETCGSVGVYLSMRA